MKRSYSLRPGEKGEWIPALEAVHLLASHLGSDRRAKRALFERLKDSAVDATAWWIATGYDVGAPYVPVPIKLPSGRAIPLSPAEMHDLRVERSKPKVSPKMAGSNMALTVRDGDIAIGGLFWRMATKEDQKQWDWPSGLFKCSYPTGEGLAEAGGKIPSEDSPLAKMRMYALGVHFHRPHVLRIIEAGGIAANLPLDPPSNRGRKKSDHWGRWVAEVIWLHEEEGIELLSASQLIDKIADRTAHTGIPVPSRSTVFKAAQETLELLRERRARVTEFP